MATFFRLLLGYMWDGFHSQERLKAEIITLRHQLNILHRMAPKRLRLSGGGRALFVWLYRRSRWKTFLGNHADGSASVDFLIVPTLAFERLFVLVILGLGRRRLLWIGVTTNPTAEWPAGQITEAFPWDTVPGFLIRDNDGAYGKSFTRRLRAMGSRDRPIAPRSPWQNGYVERSIGSISRECLDHVFIWGEAHFGMS